MQGFATGRKTFESFNYLGLGTFTIKAVAPSHEELKAIWGEEAKELTTHKVNDNGKDMGILNILFNFTTPEGTDKIIKESFFITNEFTKSKTGKIEVINEYGENAWVTEEEFSGNKKPAYNLEYLTPYRAAFKGETTLIEFIKVYLGIPPTRNFKDNKWVTKSKAELEASKACFSLESIQKFVKGDFSDLRTVLGFQPNNKIKLFMGVNVTEKGAYQRLNTQIPVPAGTKNLERPLKALNASSEYHKDVIYDYNSTEVKVWDENFTSDLSGLGSDNDPDDTPFSNDSGILAPF